MENSKIEILGIELNWKVMPQDTHDRYGVMEVTMPPGGKVPLHQHVEQEAFFILDGSAELGVDDGSGVIWNQVSPGDVINIPSDAIHGFRNGSDRQVKFLVTFEGSLGRFFQEAGTPIGDEWTASAPPSPENVQRVLAIARKLGQRFPEVP